MKLTEAQVARIKLLENTSGRLTPQQVVEDARDKGSPLHALFEWNKTKAAEAHWLQCAREILGAVKVLVTTETTVIRAPQYVRDPSVQGQGYRSVSALQRDPVPARESLIYTLEVAAGHLRRAYDLATALGLEAEIDSLVQQVIGLQRQIKQAV